MNYIEENSEFEIDKEDIGKTNAFFVGQIIELNNRRIVIQRKMNTFACIFQYLASILFTAMSLALTVVGISIWYTNEIVWWGAVFVIASSTFMASIGVVFFLRTVVRSKQYVTLNRENKTVTHPKNALSKKHITYPYEDMDIFVRGGDNSGGSKKPLYCFTGMVADRSIFMNLCGARGITLYKMYNHESLSKIANFWKYVNHYMTEESLPKGSAFILYR